MFSHTTPELLAAIDTSKLTAATSMSLAAGLTLLAIVVVLSVIANWIASLVVAQAYATIGRAFLVLIGETAAGIAFGFFGALCYLFLGSTGASEPVLAFTVLVIGVLFLVTMVAIPMQVYDIDVFRSICFLVLSWLLGFVISSTAGSMLGGAAGFAQSPAQIERLLKTLKVKQQGRDTGDSEFSERQAQLRRRQEQLEIRRKYLPPNDARALVEYQRDRDAFEREVERFRADFGD